MIDNCINEINNQYVDEDGKQIARYANRYVPLNISYVKSSLTANATESNESELTTFVSVTSTFKANENEVKFDWGYMIVDDGEDSVDVLLANKNESTFTSIHDLGKELAHQISQIDVFSSTLVRNSKSENIFASEDEFNFNDGSFGDTLDNVADTVEEMQDALDDIQEDDTNIEIDNNISDHYIVECDRCKGIFISAVVESDQKIDKISGTCPLCNKESDQYIKWVIKSVTED